MHKLYFLFFLVIFHFSIVIPSGALQSGYHFVDDHRFIQMEKDFQSDGFIKVLEKTVKEDLTWRFRPVYSALQTLECYLFGKNFFLWELSRSLYGIVTAFFLYLAFVRLGFSFLESSIFSLFSIYTRAAPIWWRLGNNETYGMLFLAFLLLFILDSSETKQKVSFKGISFYLFALLSSLSKETFILILPALALVRIWLSFQFFEKKIQSAFFKTLKGNLILFFIFVFELLAIKFGVGTETMGYAGVEGVSFMRYLKEFSHLNSLCFLYLPIVFFILALILNQKKVFKEVKKENIFFATALFFLIVLPQVISYAKVGFYERYLVPAALGYSFLGALTFYYLRKSPRNIELSNQKKNIFSSKKVAYSLVLLIMGALFLFPAFQDWIAELYSSYKGRPAKDHFFIKLSLSGIFFITVGFYQFLMTRKKIGKEIFNFKKKYYLNSWAMTLALLLILLNTGDRAVTAFRDARAYGEAGEFIYAFEASVQKETRKILLVSDPIESEFLYSLPFYLKDKFENLEFVLQPYYLPGYDDKQFEQGLRKGTLSYYKERLWSDSLEDIDLYFIRKAFLDEFMKKYKDWFKSIQWEKVDNQDYVIIIPTT